MAINLFTHLSRLTFSRWERPNVTENVLTDVLKFSIWGALGTGCAAGVSAIFSRTVIGRGNIASCVFKPSLISCGTFTAFAIFLIYRFIYLPSDAFSEARPASVKKLNAQVISLERTLGLICSAVALAAKLPRDYLNLNPMLNSLANRLVVPFLSISVTSMVIRLFHHVQLDKI